MNDAMRLAVSVIRSTRQKLFKGRRHSPVVKASGIEMGPGRSMGLELETLDDACEGDSASPTVDKQQVSRPWLRKSKEC
jgi:hypothetical protein